jgi:hypothetical protein
MRRRGKDRRTDREAAVEYLLSKWPDPYLTDALRRLSEAKIDVDQVLA